MSVLRMQNLLTSHGYELFDEPGFVAGRREGEILGLFTWGSDIHASSKLIPRRYLVVSSALGRYRLPMVEWERWMPVAEQTPRPWADVVAEFDAVLAPVLDGTAPASTLNTERYAMGGGLVGLLPEAGLVWLESTKGVHRVRHSDGEFTLSVSGRTVTAFTADGASEAIELQTDVTWEDLTDWLWRLPSLLS